MAFNLQSFLKRKYNGNEMRYLDSRYYRIFCYEINKFSGTLDEPYVVSFFKV
jgi:hypothetical protein